MTDPIHLSWITADGLPPLRNLDVSVDCFDDGDDGVLLRIRQGYDSALWPKARAGDLLAAIAEASGIRMQTWERSE